jgi:hypothetical protein
MGISRIEDEDESLGLPCKRSYIFTWIPGRISRLIG